MFLAPTFLSEGDSNHDRQLSQAEFAALARKWFTAWDTNQTGKLDAGKIRAGLDKTMMPPPNAGGPGRGMGMDPGGGMNLQGPKGKRNGLASAMGIEFVYVHADLEFEDRRFPDVAVRYKGNGTFLESRNSVKRSLKIDLNKYAKGNTLAGVSKLNLQNNVTDAGWMNEGLAYRLYRDAGVPAPRTAYARVFVTVPGKFDRKYFGLYSLSEEVDKHFAERNFGAKHGAIFKPVTPSLFADLGPEWSKYSQTYDPKTTLDEAQKSRVMDFCKLVSNANDVAFAAQAGNYIDLEEFARFMAAMVWLSDLDGIFGPGQNFYLHLHPKSQLFSFIPWDQDHSFGQFGMRGTQEQRENLSLDHPWQGNNRFLERMFKLEAFQKLYRARLQEFSQTIFKPGRFTNQVDEIAVAIRPAVAEESQTKLARFDKAVAGEILQSGGFGMFGGQGIKPIKPFVEIRTKSVMDQVAGKSSGQELGNGGFPGGPPGDPGRGPGNRSGPGGPGGFGPGAFLGDMFVEAFDQDKDSVITQAEMDQTFAKWFAGWSGDQSGALSEEQLRAGIDKDLAPTRPGPFPGFSGPPGPPSEK